MTEHTPNGALDRFWSAMAPLGATPPTPQAEAARVLFYDGVRWAEADRSAWIQDHDALADELSALREQMGGDPAALLRDVRALVSDITEHTALPAVVAHAAAVRDRLGDA